VNAVPVLCDAVLMLRNSVEVLSDAVAVLTTIFPVLCGTVAMPCNVVRERQREERTA
jgi:hypothetical protein